MDKEIINTDLISFATLALKIGAPVVIGYVGMIKYILKKTDQKIDGKADNKIMIEKFKRVDTEIENIKSSHVEIKTQLTGIDNKVTQIWQFLAENKK